MDNWKIDVFGEEVDDDLGFLQMCIERRFLRPLQLEFEKLTRLDHSRYWVESGVGGTPNMQNEFRASDYCYNKGVRVMGWSAHGAHCGGFGPDVSDEKIQQLLLDVLAERIARYPKAQHYALFATLRGDPLQTVIMFQGPFGQP